MRLLTALVLRNRSPFPAQKLPVFSVNALVVISQEPSVYEGLRYSGLQRNYTWQERVNHP